MIIWSSQCLSKWWWQDAREPGTGAAGGGAGQPREACQEPRQGKVSKVLILKKCGENHPKKYSKTWWWHWWRLMTFEPIVSGWRRTQIEWWWSRKTPPSQRTRWKGDWRTHQLFLFQIDIINLYWRYSIFYNIFVCFGRIFPNVLQCFVCVCGEFDIINWYWRCAIF